MANPGKLYLVPTPLGEAQADTLPPQTIQVLHRLRFLIAERAKTARHFIKSTNPPFSIQDLTIFELHKRVGPEEKNSFLQIVLEGHDMGVLSEAGCPGVADPGAEVVRMAHQKGIEVVPLVGPSSLLLALMASGMNGQSFSFHGYLSVKKPQLNQDLQRLEQLSRKHRQTQLFIETPYRNNALMETALATLQPETLFGIACDLTLPTALIRTKTITDWKKETLPDLHKRPTVFTLLA